MRFSQNRDHHDNYKIVFFMIMIIIIPIIVRTIAMTKILKIVMLIISYNLYIINDNVVITMMLIMSIMILI